MPDHPILIQSSEWQFNDIAHQYTKSQDFFDYWCGNIDAMIHSVAAMTREKTGPAKT
jgi:uncharacterized protein Usg